MEKPLIWLASLAGFAIAFSGLLYEYQQFETSLKIDRVFVTSILQANPQLGRKLSSTPVNFKAQCDFPLLNTVCDIIADGDEAIIPFSIEFDFFSNIRAIHWGVNELRFFPLGTLENLLKSAPAMRGASHIEFSRVLTWDPQFIMLEGRADSLPGQSFRATFMVKAFLWKLESAWPLPDQK
ncbi:MAG: hypothetical protein ACXWQE_14810 [Bdellovibrionales bacterium]